MGPVIIWLMEVSSIPRGSEPVGGIHDAYADGVGPFCSEKSTFPGKNNRNTKKAVFVLFFMAPKTEYTDGGLADWCTEVFVLRMLI